MSAYQIAYGRVDQNGNLSGGQGAYTFRFSTGRYMMRFQENGFKNAPAVILTNAEGVQRGIRNNLLDDKSENRKVSAEANVYQLYQGGSPRSSETPELKNTAFQFLAIAKSTGVTGEIGTGSDDPNNSTMPSGHTNSSVLANESNVRMAAARVDGRGNRKTYAAYDCSLDADSMDDDEKQTGVYRINFTTGFTAVPVVVTTVEQATETVHTVVVKAASTTFVDIEIYNKDGNLSDANFNLIAIGPGSNNSAASKFVYGIIFREGEKMFGDGFSAPTTTTGTKSGTATYGVTFSTAFQSEPVIVACVEHMAESHLRQAQVTTSKTGVSIDVVGRRRYGDTPAYNTSTVHFIAYAPS